MFNVTREGGKCGGIAILCTVASWGGGGLCTNSMEESSAAAPGSSLAMVPSPPCIADGKG